MSKKGFAYYNVDTDRYQDRRIKKLKRDLGCAGITVYDFILCEIYRINGCYIEWDESTAFDVADYFGLKETLVNEIVTYCGNVGLFHGELLTRGKIITSQSIQSRFQEMCRRTKRRDSEIPEKAKIYPEEQTKCPEELKETPEVLLQSKVKKSKEEESKVTTPENFSSIQEVEFQNVYDEVTGSQQWIENVALHQQKTASHVLSKLKEFMKELELKDDYHKGLKEIKGHFVNWVKIEIEKENRLNPQGLPPKLTDSW